MGNVQREYQSEGMWPPGWHTKTVCGTTLATVAMTVTQHLMCLHHNTQVQPSMASMANKLRRGAARGVKRPTKGSGFRVHQALDPE